ncbi:MAG: hypothetical protein LBF77_08170 [Spirochaetaceae bacterium]|jgi:hypothetical protein|nr:hypothetical protein [Spirochaetaceae bacterium]
MEQDTTASSSHIPWHPAFVQAIKLELEQYQDVLEFTSEYQLTAEPLKIDVVIIKKAPELVIKKNIARIFKRVNILEYKSPEDYFSVYDFYKVLSYVYLYAALHKVDITDMTISIIETRHPRELLLYFEQEGHCRVEETAPGIYSVSGYPMAIQVIETKKLPLRENLWLKGLSNDLNAEAAGTILEAGWKRAREVEIGAYLYAILSANGETIEEVYRMGERKIALNEVLEKIGLTAEWERRGEARGEARGEKNGWEKAIGLLKEGYTLEQLEQMTPGAPR